jgi:hypothetical protein
LLALLLAAAVFRPYRRCPVFMPLMQQWQHLLIHGDLGASDYECTMICFALLL